MPSAVSRMGHNLAGSACKVYKGNGKSLPDLLAKTYFILFPPAPSA